MANLVVQVTGLRDVQKTLRKIEGMEQSKELTAGLRESAKFVAVEARKLVPVGPARKGKPAPGRARASIGWAADTRGAYVLGGKRQLPYYAWLDFGSRNPVEGRPRSVGPWKASGAGPFRGRFIYKAIDDNEETIVKNVLAAVNKLAGQ